jgi:hypothetical protein
MEKRLRLACMTPAIHSAPSFFEQASSVIRQIWSALTPSQQGPPLASPSRRRSPTRRWAKPVAASPQHTHPSSPHAALASGRASCAAPLQPRAFCALAKTSADVFGAPSDASLDERSAASVQAEERVAAAETAAAEAAAAAAEALEAEEEAARHGDDGRLAYEDFDLRRWEQFEPHRDGELFFTPQVRLSLRAVGM